MTNKAKKGEKLSAEQICKILHISKRKCAWMLQNGMIPCKDSGKKTRRYTVLRKDLDAYIKDSTAHPEKYFIPVTFTSNNPGKREPDKYYLYPHQVPEDFRPWLDDQWYDLPDVITPKDVETILGYEHESVRRWINRGWLQITKAHKRRDRPTRMAHRFHLRLSPSARRGKAKPTASCWINTSVNAYHPSRAPLPKGFFFSAYYCFKIVNATEICKFFMK